MAIFIKINGIKGNVTAKGHEGCIAAHSLHHTFEQDISMPVGRPQDRTRAKPQFSKVILTKSMDNATNALLSKAYAGTVIPEVECNIVSTGDNLAVSAKYLFKNVLIANYDTSVSTSGDPIETLGLHFTKMETTYLGRSPDNSLNSSQVTGYDLEKADIL